MKIRSIHIVFDEATSTEIASIVAAVGNAKHVVIETGEQHCRQLDLACCEDAEVVADDHGACPYNSHDADPDIKVIPRKWCGEDMKGKTMSECSKEFLLVYAEFQDWSADDTEKRNDSRTWRAPALRRLANTARGWAKVKEQAEKAATARLSKKGKKL
jgi:hypothetical protein